MTDTPATAPQLDQSDLPDGTAKSRKGHRPPAAPRPPTFDRLKKKKKLEEKVTVYLDDDAIAAYDDAKQLLATARRSRTSTTDEIAQLEATVDARRADVEAHSMTLVFRSIGRKRYDKLVNEHPPSDEQNAEYQQVHKQNAPYDDEHFAPELVAESCVAPKMTVEQVTELFDEWNNAEIIELFVAALKVNTQRRVVELGKGRG